ncbi:MAG: ribose 5-phosphate isomerase A [Legionellaceae bacterium]|nr:ribose 5-phosphate isomerase A [Legionellaceae bacterium]HCA89645.1 ribose 5-phosphate isomerase A [Legionellales bacterium]|tara:strand:- start:2911 stop:3588 length:678 start_codon:yes stop_codon:yes gene_type:complete
MFGSCARQKAKKNAAQAALQYIPEKAVLGIGTGSTVNYFIEALADIKGRIEGCIPSSYATEKLLKTYHLPIIELNHATEIPYYIDGADEITSEFTMIKGGGGALTREKIVALNAQTFICLVDETKVVKQLGQFPIAVEVLPMARSYVARQIVNLGGNPVYRPHFLTDNHNIILDIFDLNLSAPLELESALKAIPGVIESGVFAKRRADKVIIGSHSKTYELTKLE